MDSREARRRNERHKSGIRFSLWVAVQAPSGIAGSGRQKV